MMVMVVTVGEVAMVIAVVVVVRGKIVLVELVDENYLINGLVHFSTYHRIDLDH